MGHENGMRKGFGTSLVRHASGRVPFPRRLYRGRFQLGNALPVEKHRWTGGKPAAQQEPRESTFTNRYYPDYFPKLRFGDSMNTSLLSEEIGAAPLPRIECGHGLPVPELGQ